MKKELLLLALAFNLSAFAQTAFVTDFENLGISPGQYYSTTTNGTGFQAGHAFFGAHYDNTFGFWSDGWAASAVHDSSTAGSGNTYGCAAYNGYSGSSTFGVGNTTGYLTLRLTDSLLGKTVSGFYLCNTTYAYKSMKFGDSFAKKFGDTTGTGCGCAQGGYPDWFKLTIKKYLGGVLYNDSVEFYLADFRFSNSAQDYILKTWTWVNLTSLGSVDSLAFFLHSTDNGSFGMNTPAFFCMDNLTLVNAVGIASYDHDASAEIFPNPAADDVEISFDANGGEFVKLIASDMTGREMAEQNICASSGKNKFRIDVSQWSPGVYPVHLQIGEKIITRKLIKQ